MNEKEMLFIAEKLENLEKEKNNGRGIQCVKTVITCLKKEKLDTAKAVVSNEWDKISSYDDIAILPKEKGLV